MKNLPSKSYGTNEALLRGMLLALTKLHFVRALPRSHLKENRLAPFFHSGKNLAIIVVE